MNSTLTSQHVVARPVAPAVTTACATTNHATTPSYMTWLGGIGSKVTTFEDFASERPTTRPFAEALT